MLASRETGGTLPTPPAVRILQLKKKSNSRYVYMKRPFQNHPDGDASGRAQKEGERSRAKQIGLLDNSIETPDPNHPAE